MSISSRARDFAAKAHAGQMYGPDESYMVHLDAVVKLVGDDIEAAKAIAYLHDVVEDTGVDIHDIGLRFGGFVADCVSLVTDEPGANRKERKAATHAKLAKVKYPFYLALVVKAADRCANVEACIRKGNTGLLKMYQDEQEAFRGAVYRPGLCDHLWQRIDNALKARASKGGDNE